ncbi:hypothetical protein [Streptomyces sp. N2A]|uniref:hypothetical protein n=1 Tax=Streptomyces sp. N2A TaxID=3073936 RepID=UPI00287031EF|nr:hypothetical protein [Streptomyces sp. N2A]
MPLDRPTPPPYGAAPNYTLAPPRAEDRLDTLALPLDLRLPPPRPEDRVPGGPWRADDRPLPPRPEERLQGPVALPDHRRPDLQAALTAAGIAPEAEDAVAVAQIAGLGDATVRAVIGWIEAAGRTSWARPHAV